jgi:diguanylate cyclase (GGDEF)-like protein
MRAVAECNVGGEEFAVVLPEASLAKAFDAAERLRTALETAAIEVAGEKIAVTASIGVAEYTSCETSIDGGAAACGVKLKN